MIPVDLPRQREILASFGVGAKAYACTICRIEPENNCHLILEAFSKTDIPLVFIGNWNLSAYGRELKAEYGRFCNIHIVDPVYDREQLFVLRKQCLFYIHGHSAGGTNPSLVEAMSCGAPILAFDVGYWSTPEELAALAHGNREEISDCMEQLADEYYTWRKVVGQYEAIY